jgi:peptidyl-prolyl cis-trans isomerase A (cyclophilin A)
MTAETHVPDGPLLAILVTSMGEVTVSLDEHLAPNNVRNFVGLCRGTQPFRDPRLRRVVVGESFYAGTTLHRVEPDAFVVGGDRLGTGWGGAGYRIADEPSRGHDAPGVLAMANCGPNTASSQFFLTVGAAPWLDGAHTVLGVIVHGLDVVAAISRVPADARGRPLRPVRVQKIDIRREPLDARP